MKATRVALGAAVLVATLGGSVASGGSADPEGVLPDVVWDGERQAIFVMPPPRVAAWVDGALPDESGLLEQLARAYEAQRQSPEFAGAVLEIRRLVQAAGDLPEAEVNLRLIPEILRIRGDLRAQLVGGASRTLSDPGDCWKEYPGKLTCEVFGWFACLKLACKMDPANTCTIYMPCEEVGAIKGLDDPDSKDFLR